MSDDEDQPLLQDEDTDEITKPLSVTKASSNRLTITLADIVEEKEIDIIFAIFVATFDSKSGNIIEWVSPKNFNLDSIEFKSIPSGAHTVHTDFIYFRYEKLFGLGCFARRNVNSDAERGARMKTVGIISPSYTTLYKHMQFLESQVQIQLETPGRYDSLEEFLKDHQLPYPLSINIDQPLKTPRDIKSKLPIMKITHPAGCFSQFINFFGPNIFILWKLVLLRKKILFFSPPPIGVVCYRVYCACCLGKITSEELYGSDNILYSLCTNTNTVKPFFYVNVADIDVISNEETYIACTTEKVFQDKPQLYDVYIDNQIVTSHLAHLQPLMKINKTDLEKYNNLINHKNDLQHQRSTGREDLPTEEAFYQSYFTQQNNEIFQTLLDISNSTDRIITNDHIRAMGLDPCGDRSFIMDLLELYGIDALLVADNPCCPV